MTGSPATPICDGNPALKRRERPDRRAARRLDAFLAEDDRGRERDHAAGAEMREPPRDPVPRADRAVADDLPPAGLDHVAERDRSSIRPVLPRHGAHDTGRRRASAGRCGGDAMLARMDERRRRGPLDAAELAEAAVLGDLALVLAVAGLVPAVRARSCSSPRRSPTPR